MLTRAMIRALRRAVKTGSFYEIHLGEQHLGQQSVTVDRLASNGYLGKKPRGYVEITDKGYAALGMRRPES